MNGWKMLVVGGMTAASFALGQVTKVVNSDKPPPDLKKYQPWLNQVANGKNDGSETPADPFFEPDAKLKKELERTRAELKQQQAELANANRATQEGRAKAGELQEKVQALQQSEARLNSELTAAQTATTQAQTQVLAERERSKKHATAIKDALDSAQKQIITLEKERDDHRQQVEALQANANAGEKSAEKVAQAGERTRQALCATIWRLLNGRVPIDSDAKLVWQSLDETDTLEFEKGVQLTMKYAAITNGQVEVTVNDGTRFTLAVNQEIDLPTTTGKSFRFGVTPRVLRLLSITPKTNDAVFLVRAKTAG